MKLSEQDKQELQAELCQVKQEKDELAQKYHTLKSQQDAVSNKCQTTVSVLKDSEKRQREFSNINEELVGENQHLRQQLMFERESKQKLESDMEKLRDEGRRLEEDKRKLKDENEALAQEKLKLQQKIERLTDVNKSLQIRNNQLSESGEKMQRTNSDLSNQIYQIRQMHRQHTSKSDSDVTAAQSASDCPIQEHSNLYHEQGLKMPCTPSTASSDCVQETEGSS